MMSSQSFHLVVENDMDVMDGSFKDAMGTDNVDAFFEREPEIFWSQRTLQ